MPAGLQPVMSLPGHVSQQAELNIKEPKERAAGRAVQANTDSSSRLSKRRTVSTGDNERPQVSAKAKTLPVLPWMRVPIRAEGGKGSSLRQVKGLSPLALTALQCKGCICMPSRRDMLLLLCLWLVQICLGIIC